MDLYKISTLFFVIDKYFNGNYDMLKYNWKLPENMTNIHRKYYRQNKYHWEKFSKWNLKESEIKALGIINIVKYKMSFAISDEISKKDMNDYKMSIIHHVTFFKNDLENFIYDANSGYDVFVLYKQKKIQWYSFLYSLLLIQYKFDDDLKFMIKEDMQMLNNLRRLMKLDINSMKGYISPLKRKYQMGLFK